MRVRGCGPDRRNRGGRGGSARDGGTDRDRREHQLQPLQRGSAERRDPGRQPVRLRQRVLAGPSSELRARRGSGRDAIVAVRLRRHQEQRSREPARHDHPRRREPHPPSDGHAKRRRRHRGPRRDVHRGQSDPAPAAATPAASSSSSSSTTTTTSSAAATAVGRAEHPRPGLLLPGGRLDPHVRDAAVRCDRGDEPELRSGRRRRSRLHVGGQRLPLTWRRRGRLRLYVLRSSVRERGPRRRGRILRPLPGERDLLRRGIQQLFHADLLRVAVPVRAREERRSAAPS